MSAYAEKMIERLRSLRPAATPALAGVIALVLLSVVVIAARSDRAPSATRVEGAQPPDRPAIVPSSGAAQPTNAVSFSHPRGSSPPRAKSAGCGSSTDFDGDDFEDFAIGVPRENVNGVSDAGMVQIVYGTRRGLAGAGNLLITQDTPGVPDEAETDDLFGLSFAGADFNGDGRDDLAIGAPEEDVVNSNEGSVTVLYGTARGLSAKGSQVWTQETAGIEEDAAIKDSFGHALAAGDFDADGFADLAIGVPFEDLQRKGYLSANGSAGTVNILYGTRNGLSAARNHLVNQDTDGMPDDAEGVDLFGWSLTAGDFNGDRFCDFAAGVPGERIGSVEGAGAVNVFYGTARGITGAGGQFWNQDSPGVQEKVEQGEQFGYGLTAGDFDGDGADDLAVGVLGEDIGTINDAGGVNVLYGSRKGLTASRNRFWSQETPGIGDAGENGDEAGRALVSGDFNGDGREDLAIGVHNEAISRATLTGEERVEGAGAVTVIYGSRSGLAVAGNQFWSQDSDGLLDQAEDADNFGLALAAGDFDHNGSFDLAIGVPGEGYAEKQARAGGVNVLYGARGKGLRSAGNQLWRQGVELPGTPEQQEEFGAGLA